MMVLLIEMEKVGCGWGRVSGNWSGIGMGNQAFHLGHAEFEMSDRLLNI